MSLLYAADRADHLLYREELERMAAAEPRFDFADADRWTVELKPCTHSLNEHVRRQWIEADTERGRQFYICGIGKGVIALRDLLRGSGYERRAVRYEQW